MEENNKFNPEVPYNELPHLPPKIDLETPKIFKQLVKSRVALAKLDALTKNKLNNKEIFLEPFALRESVESSQIENINTTLNTTYQSKYETSLKPEQKETLSYRDALERGYETVSKYGFLRTSDIFEMWWILSDKWVKRTSAWVNITKSSYEWDKVLYTPPIGLNSEWKEIIWELLDNLISFFNWGDQTEIDPLVQTAMIHYQFEAIHPFYDWNGRTGRVLMMLHLKRTGLLCYPVLFLSAFINKTKNDYYKLIENVTAKWEWEEFILYILKWIEVQSERTLNIIEKLIDYREKTRKKLLEIEWLKTNSVEWIYELLWSKVYFTQDDIREKCWVSINMWPKLYKIIVDNSLWKDEKIWKRKVIFNEEFLKIFES